MVGIAADSFPEAGDRFCRAPEFEQDSAEMVMDVRRTGGEGLGVAQRRDRLVEAALHGQ